MKKIKILIKTKSKKYPIIIGSKIINTASNIFKSNNIFFEKSLIVYDTKVPIKNLNILKKNIKAKTKIVHHFNSSEKNKNLKNINSILNKLFKLNFNRNDCIISLGGGITGDVSGFAASIYKRGLKFINIPTTLLAQVDSSIGGKTGVNNIYGKNLIGSFMQPDLVLSDINFLKSLPKRELICGYGEILKHSIIDNRNSFNFLKKNFNKILNLESSFIIKAIADSCKIKKSIVEKDENEKNLRQLLNFGHTFAHAFEGTNNYSKKLNHGEAVLLGMFCASNFAKQKKIINKNEFNKIIAHYKKLKFSFKIEKYYSKKNINKILSFMKKDKKNNNNKINLVLLKKIGQGKYNCEFNISEIKKFFIKELIN